MEMDAPIGSNALDVGAQGVVGKPLDRVDGRLKVTGGARYAYEVEQGPKTAYGFVVEASIGKGQIKSMDTGPAERAPGVILVLTYRNAPQQGTGNHHIAHPVLTSPEVLYYGLPIAFVVAETFEEARAAAYLVRVNYERSPGRFALRGGLGQGARATGRPPARQRSGRFRRRFCCRSHAARRHLHHASAKPGHDGAPRHARDVGRRQPHPSHFQPDAEIRGATRSPGPSRFQSRTSG